MPGGTVTLFVLLIVMALLTRVIPAGQYARVESPDTGRMIVDPTSFEFIDKTLPACYSFLQPYPVDLLNLQM